MIGVWSQLRNVLIREAEIPPDSQTTVATSKAVERCIVYATAYNLDMYCLLIDSNSLDCWECNPVLKFVTASGDRSYPATRLPEARHVLGMEANAETSIIVLGHFSHFNSESAICIDIYFIDAAYKATLLQSISTETKCSGSGLLGTFASPTVDQYIVLWGDLTNNDFFDTFAAKKLSAERTSTTFLRTPVDAFTLPFQQVNELYPAINNTVYNCHAYGVGHKHPNCLAVLVYHADLNNRTEPEIRFQTVVKLPLTLHFTVEDIVDSASERYPTVIVRMKQNSDGAMVCLVRVAVVTVDALLPAVGGVSEEAADTVKPSGAVDSRATTTHSNTTVAMSARPTHRYVYLLLSLSDHTVLDMYLPNKYEKCTIDVTGRHIVRFLASKLSRCTPNNLYVKTSGEPDSELNCSFRVEKCRFLYRWFHPFVQSSDQNSYPTMLPFACHLCNERDKQKVRAMEEKRLKLIQKAEFSKNSKRTIPVPNAVQEYIEFANPYGDDMYCLLLNKASIKQAFLPVLLFMHASGVGSYLETKLPKTRHVFGIEANATTNTVVMGHFMHADASSVIRIDIFSVDADYNITLMQSVSYKTHYDGGRLLRAFASPTVGEYIVILSEINRNFFDTYTVRKASDSAVPTDFSLIRCDLQYFQVKFVNVEELYPSAHDAVFHCQTRAAGVAFSDCLAVTVHHADLKGFQRPRVVFHTVIKLPYKLHYCVKHSYYGADPKFPAVIQHIKSKEDGSIVCLVRVVTLVSTPTVPVYSIDSTGNQHITPRPPRQSDSKEVYVHLLLSMPQHTVLDSCISYNCDKRCAIDVTGEYIVRFVATPDEITSTSDAVPSADSVCVDV